MKHSLFCLIIFCFLFAGCKKEYDLPPLSELPDGEVIFVHTIKSRVPAPGKNHRFASGDSCLYCTVLADESNGNLYREIFARDDAGDAIRLRLVNSGAIFTGDRLRIKLTGLYAVNANAMVYIDSIDIVKNTVKISSGNKTQPLEITLSALLSGTVSEQSHRLQSQLIRITGVEFIPNNLLPTFADAISGSAADQALKDCADNRLLVRTSGFANFAGKHLPSGNGSLTGILTQYNDRLQLIIRNYTELDMTGAPCSVTSPSTAPSVIYLKKDFNDNSLTSGGWTTFTVTNSSINWSIASFSTTPSPFAKISGFMNGANRDSETWYISPALSFSTAGKPYLSFQTAAKYPGNLLEVLVSANYSGGGPASGTWQSLAGSYSLSPAPATGGYVWTSSGKVDLSGYTPGTLRIAFKYSSTPAGATTYELDNVVVQED